MDGNGYSCCAPPFMRSNLFSSLCCTYFPHMMGVEGGGKPIERFAITARAVYPYYRVKSIIPIAPTFMMAYYRIAVCGFKPVMMQPHRQFSPRLVSKITVLITPGIHCPSGKAEVE